MRQQSFQCLPVVQPILALTRCLLCEGAKRPCWYFLKAELLWASARELLNVFQADAIGCEYHYLHQRSYRKAKSSW